MTVTYGPGAVAAAHPIPARFSPVSDLPLVQAAAESMFHHGITLSEARDALAREFLWIALVENDFNVMRAARALCSHRNTVSRQIHELGLQARIAEYRKVKVGLR